MVHKKYRLPKELIPKLYRNQQVLRGENFIIHNMSNSLSHVRFGVVVSKKVSKSAVVRNRFKRVFREAMRDYLSSYSKDMLITILPGLDASIKLNDAKTLLKSSFERLPQKH